MAWRYFSVEGDPMLACPCCDVMGMDAGFMAVIDEIRHQCGFPFKVNSGFRCGPYNNSMAKTGLEGPHTTGRAIDIRAPGAGMRYIIMETAQQHGLQRFGIGPSFIHLDNLHTMDRFPTGIWPYS